MDWYFGQSDGLKYLKSPLFLTNAQLFPSQHDNWWTGVVWITCDVFISCLDSHSDGTHSLERILFFKFICTTLFTMQIVAKQLYRKLHFYIIISNSLSLVSKWCNATFLQICSDEQTNSSTVHLGCNIWNKWNTSFLVTTKLWGIHFNEGASKFCRIRNGVI